MEESLDTALFISRCWLRPQLAGAWSTYSEHEERTLRTVQGLGLLGQEQTPIPKSLVTDDRGKKYPSKMPSTVVPVSPAFNFKVLENEGTTLWTLIQVGFLHP